MSFPDFKETVLVAKNDLRSRRYKHAYLTLQKFIEMEHHYSLSEGIRAFTLLVTAVNKILLRHLKRRNFNAQSVGPLADGAEGYFYVLYAYLELSLGRAKSAKGPVEQIEGLSDSQVQNISEYSKQKVPLLNQIKHDYGLPLQKHYSALFELRPDNLLERALLPCPQIPIDHYLELYFQQLIRFLVARGQLYRSEGKVRLAYCYFEQAIRLGDACLARSRPQLLSEIINSLLSMAAFLCEVGSAEHPQLLQLAIKQAEKALVVSSSEIQQRKLKFASKNAKCSRFQKQMTRSYKRIAFGCLIVMFCKEALHEFGSALEMAQLGRWFCNNYIRNDMLKKYVLYDCQLVIQRYQSYLQESAQLERIAKSLFPQISCDPPQLRKPSLLLQQQIYEQFNYGKLNRNSYIVGGEIKPKKAKKIEISSRFQQEEEAVSTFTNRKQESRRCPSQDFQNVFSILDSDYEKPDDSSDLVESSLIFQDLSAPALHDIKKGNKPKKSKRPNAKLIKQSLLEQHSQVFSQYTIMQNPITGKELPEVDSFDPKFIRSKKLANEVPVRPLRQMLADHVRNQQTEKLFMREIQFAKQFLHVKNREFHDRKYRPFNPLQIKSEAQWEVILHAQAVDYLGGKRLPDEPKLKRAEPPEPVLSGKALMIDILLLNKEQLGILRLNQKYEINRKRKENRLKHELKEKERMKEKELEIQYFLDSSNKPQSLRLIKSDQTRPTEGTRRSPTQRRTIQARRPTLTVCDFESALQRHEQFRGTGREKSRREKSVQPLSFNASLKEDGLIAKKISDKMRTMKSLQKSKQVQNLYIGQNEAMKGVLAMKLQMLTCKKKKRPAARKAFAEEHVQLGQSAKNYIQKMRLSKVND